MDKSDELKKLTEEMVNDTSLPLREANLAFWEGDPDCQILFIGEAPGMNEDREKRPFVGGAGRLLRKHIRALGWKEEEVYITNIVKRRPPENRDPSPEEIEAYRPYLARQIEIIAPKIIIPLGRFSMNFFLPEAKISRDQGKLFKVALSAGEAGGYWHVAPMFHPSAALRGNTMMKAFTDSFKKLPTMLKTIKGDTNIRMTSQSTNPKMETVKNKKITRFDKKILARVNELFLEWWAKRKYKVSSEYF